MRASLWLRASAKAVDLVMDLAMDLVMDLAMDLAAAVIATYAGKDLVGRTLGSAALQICGVQTAKNNPMLTARSFLR